MARVAFYRTLSAPARAELDTEIRRRGYGDALGLCAWLAERNVTIGKSVVSQYARALKRRDEELGPAPFSPEARVALFYFAQRALQARAAFDQLLITLEK